MRGSKVPICSVFGVSADAYVALLWRALSLGLSIYIFINHGSQR